MVSRLNFLDASRGIAALLVINAHFLLTYFPDFTTSKLNVTPLHLFWDANAAVLYFFVLSGFVLTRSLKGKTLNIKEYQHFVIKRIVRIYPAFIVCLIVTYTLLHFLTVVHAGWLADYWNEVPRFYEMLKQALLVVRWPNDPHLRIIHIDWTLSIEIAVSLILPLLAVLSRINSMIFLMAIYTSVKLLNLDPFVFDFSLGVAIATSQDSIFNWIHKHLSMWWIFVAGWLLVISDYTFPALINQSDHILIHHKSWGLAFLLISILSSTRLKLLLQTNFFIFTGKISYSIYLFHLPALLIVTQLRLPYVICFLIFIALTYFFSFLSYQWIEQKFKWKQYHL